LAKGKIPKIGDIIITINNDTQKNFGRLFFDGKITYYIVLDEEILTYSYYQFFSDVVSSNFKEFSNVVVFDSKVLNL